MIGAPYEFDLGRKTKDFELFTPRSHYTDDTVMTVAVAEALLGNRDLPEENGSEHLKQALSLTIQNWGRRYPHAGYGTRFSRWIWVKDPEPYGSYGNGSAMRVSCADWLYDTLERTREIARVTAE